MSEVIEKKSNLIKALVKFQSEVPAIPKNKKNPFYNSMYAELSTVIDTCVPVLTKNGLAVSQTMSVLTVAGKNVLITKLLHESGEYEESSLLLPDIADAQKLTASITYLRRAQYLAIVGLVAEDDEDGNTPPPKNDNRQQNNNQNRPTGDNRNGNNNKPASSGTPANGAPAQVVLASAAQKNALTRLYNLENGGKVDWDINKLDKNQASELIKAAPTPKK